MKYINLKCTPILGIGYDWITFGSLIDDVLKKLEIPVSIRDEYEKIELNDFSYIKYKLGSKGSYWYDFLFEDIVYKNDSLRMTFKNGILERILLGLGWEGSILRLYINKTIFKKIGDMDLCFDDGEDELYLQDSHGNDIQGLSIWTNYMSPPDKDKPQQIEKIKLWMP